MEEGDPKADEGEGENIDDDSIGISKSCDS